MQPGTLYIEPKTVLSSWSQELKSDGFTSVHMAHFGTLNQDLVNSFTVNVEEFMISAGDKKPLVKRIFSILIEGLQNILIHGLKWQNEQQALLIVAHNEKAYRVVLGNLTNKSEIPKLTATMDRLNAMNDEEVKSHYLETLNNGLISEKGGAGLGFITIRMKSKAPLDYRFVAVNDELVLFTIATDIVKD